MGVEYYVHVHIKLSNSFVTSEYFFKTYPPQTIFYPLGFFKKKN